jgi:hypothetical protein
MWALLDSRNGVQADAGGFREFALSQSMLPTGPLQSVFDRFHIRSFLIWVLYMGAFCNAQEAITFCLDEIMIRGKA